MSGRKGLRSAVAVVCVLLAVAVGAVVYHLATRPGGGGRGLLARTIGADSCDYAGFELANDADGTRDPVYDCRAGARRWCVTVRNAVAHDETATVRALFAGAPAGGRRPLCIGG